MPLHVVLSTCPEAEAARLAEAIVGERLAACCNRVAGVASTYWWEGRLNTETEALLIFKTPAERVEALTARLGELHPYDVPEILALPVASGLEAYMAWVRRETAEF